MICVKKAEGADTTSKQGIGRRYHRLEHRFPVMLALQQGGSNALRGGKKKYGPKTKCGNWVELNKEPGQTLPAGFPHAMYRTDAHQQMLDGVLQRPKRFGAGLPPPEDAMIDYSRVINYDKQQGDSRWAGITSTEFVSPRKCGEKSKEFASSFKLTGGMTDPDKLREYRRAWTVEKDCVRPVRFRTDAVASANTGVPLRFRTIETRKLPGTPKAVERLRAKALENGQMGVVQLRQALQCRLADETAAAATDGAGACWRQRLVQPSDLTEGLRGAGLKPISAFDAQKASCGNGDGNSGGNSDGATIADIFEGLSLGGPTMNEHRSRAVTDAFQELNEGGSGVIGAGDLRRRYDSAASCSRCCPTKETRRALLDNFSLYEEAGRDGMTRAGFEGFMADALCGVESDAEFDAVLEALVGK
ncbi:unnamed protein product [Pylaiella littoralis]